MPEKLGKFRCVSGHIFREEAYIQWGSSTESLGACLTLKPGTEERDHPNVLRLKHGESAQVPLSTEDDTLKQLEAFIRRIHYGEEPEGRLYLYNLFPLVVKGTENSILQFETMVRRGELNPGEAVPSKEELREHPWILIGWGINREKGGEDLAYAKHRWMTAVQESGIPWFGKKEHRRPIIITLLRKSGINVH
ncbi:hypothetical protein [Salimicrobium flavidum]|uniref:DUF1643 domain-containing protein n=1 Tax=Salimicrobium flavidum TaxID=570947 RepID=A0A1N7JFK9_9BACI|nr:hypothetical protein [Salimicrobium flavidum]SIS48098.1 hypothetical protein SAMN05421687_105216 [Salimicrobium flavidum]